MPSDSAKKSRLVVDRDLVRQIQAEAERRGLGNKTPSALADLILRAWLRSAGETAAASPSGGAQESLAARVAALETRLALMDQFAGRLARLERERLPIEHVEASPPTAAEPKEILADTEGTLGGPDGNTLRLPDGRDRSEPKAKDSKRIPKGSKGASSGPTGSRKVSAASEGTLRGFAADTLRRAMESKGMSANALGEALGYRDKGATVSKWLRGKARVPAKHREKVAELLAPAENSGPSD